VRASLWLSLKFVFWGSTSGLRYRALVKSE